MRDKFFLWHLEHLGILTRGTGGFRAPLWAEAQAADPVTVALIDTGIDVAHPNLAGAMAAPQIDFGPAAGGVVHIPGGQRVAALRAALSLGSPRPDEIDAALSGMKDDVTANAARLGLDPEAIAAAVSEALDAAAGDKVEAAGRVLSKLRSPRAFPPHVPGTPSDATTEAVAELGLSPAHTTALTACAANLAAGPVELPLEDPARYFGAHGTAMAGLICGRPADGADFGALPYRGANPYARLISYATPFGPEIRPVLTALLAAYLSGAEVIAMPRGVLDVARRTGLATSPARLTRIERDDGTRLQDADTAAHARLREDTDLLKALLGAIARRRYLVLAAGNEGWPDRVAYPASAVVDVFEALIVGAETGDRRPAPYSNGRDMRSRLLRFVSDDAPVANADELRVDASAATGWDHDLGAHGTVSTVYPFAPLATDLRGNWGYSASAQAEEPGYARGEVRPALYTPFGGTSAATALAAGTISLLVQAGRLPRTGGAGTEAVRAELAKAGLRVG